MFDHSWNLMLKKFSSKDHQEKKETVHTGVAPPNRVITVSVLSSGSLATSNEHLALAVKSYGKRKSTTLEKMSVNKENGIKGIKL